MSEAKATEQQEQSPTTYSTTKQANEKEESEYAGGERTRQDRRNKDDRYRSMERERTALINERDSFALQLARTTVKLEGQLTRLHEEDAWLRVVRENRFADLHIELSRERLLHERTTAELIRVTAERDSLRIAWAK